MSLFVSVASYRDSQCKKTIQSIFEYAAEPDRVIVGVCEQNHPGQPLETCGGLDKWKARIRTIKLHHGDARGPTYARHLCSTLWDGETYFLQLDSHVALVPKWDKLLIDMLTGLEKTTGNPKIALSTYVDVIENYPRYLEGERAVVDNVPRICQAFLNERNLVSLHGAQGLRHTEPVRNAFVAGGLFFVRAQPFLTDVGFDPWLHDLFVPEEILLSARLFTWGYDVYTPNVHIAFHHFTREGHPKFWDNRTDDTDAVKRARYILGQSKDPGPLNRNLDRYGVGKKRTLREFWEFAGIDPHTGKVTKSFCPGDLFPDPVDSASRRILQRKSHRFAFSVSVGIVSTLVLLVVFFTARSFVRRV